MSNENKTVWGVICQDDWGDCWFMGRVFRSKEAAEKSAADAPADRAEAFRLNPDNTAHFEKKNGGD